MAKKAFTWLSARTWGRWAMAFAVVILFSYLNAELYLGYDRTSRASHVLVIAAFVLLTSFTPKVPADKTGIRIVGFPLFSTMRPGQVVTSSLWYQGPYAHPIPPGTSVFFPLIKLWMGLGWFRIEHRDLTEVDPREVAVLVSNINATPAKEEVLYWGNGEGEYSGAILKAEALRDAKSRGILRCVLPPGKHSISRDMGTQQLGAFRVVTIDTSRNTVHLDDHAPEDRAHHKFEPMLLKTKNGFSFRAKVEVVFQVKDMVEVTTTEGMQEKLAGPGLIVARNGSLQDYVRDSFHPITTAVINATAVELEIDQFLDDMKGVQEHLQKSIEQEIRRTLPRGQHEPEVLVHQVSMVFDSKGFPQTEEYIRARNTTALQPALEAMKIAEAETAKKDLPLQQAKARAKYAEVEELANIKAAAAAKEAEADSARLKVKVEALTNAAKGGVSALGQVVLGAHDLFHERNIEEGEQFRDRADISRERVAADRDQVIRDGAPERKRQKRKGRGGAPQAQPQPADTDMDEGEDTEAES